MIFAYEGMVFDLEQRLGAEFAGKVMLATSHSHSAWAQFTGHGAAQARRAASCATSSTSASSTTFEAAARDALAARRPAKLGVFDDGDVRSDRRINRDRRGENDMLPGGDREGRPPVPDPRRRHRRRADRDGAGVRRARHAQRRGQPVRVERRAGRARARARRSSSRRRSSSCTCRAPARDTSPAGHGGIDCNDQARQARTIRASRGRARKATAAPPSPS